ncbi:TldD/PmbA family protein [Candidatus Woesearchaeota archaeon]|nr:TldD/PmbA family protein [Candidatus Woesearchaeota archaeon]
MDSQSSTADFAVQYMQKRGASYVEARLEQKRGASFVFKNGVLQGGGIEDVHGLGVRYLYKKALGFVAINNLKKDNVKSALSRSLAAIKASQNIAEPVALSTEDIHRQSFSVPQKIDGRDISPEAKIQALKDIDNAILKAKEKAKAKVPARFLSLSDSTTSEYLVTSEGTRVRAVIPRVNFFYFITLAGKRPVQRYWQYGQTGGWEFVKAWNLPERLGAEVAVLNKNAEKGIRAPKKAIDVVCGSEISGIMVHESVGHPFEADRILGREAAQAGESFVSLDMLGTRIGSNEVTVIDDPTIVNSNGFYLYDNEGVKARKKVLIKQGIINEFLHNRQTAAACNMKSNGSSRASEYDKESIVRMSNTYLAPGDYSEDELLEDIKEGIYMKSFTEWNIDDKRYNQKYVGAEAYLIRNGEIVAPVFQPVLEIATPILWKAVDAAADNLEYHAGDCGKGEPMQGIPVWLGGPSIRLRNVQMR